LIKGGTVNDGGGRKGKQSLYCEKGFSGVSSGTEGGETWNAGVNYLRRKRKSLYKFKRKNFLGTGETVYRVAWGGGEKLRLGENAKGGRVWWWGTDLTTP